MSLTCHFVIFLDQCDQMWRFRANVAFFGIPLASNNLEVALASNGEKKCTKRKFGFYLEKKGKFLIKIGTIFGGTVVTYLFKK